MPDRARHTRAFFLVFLSPVLLTVIVLAISQHVRGLERRPDPDEAGEASYREVMALIEDRYVGEVPREKLIYGALNGMAAVLDRYSRAYDAREWNSFERSSKGNDVGIGIQFGNLLGRLTVLQVVPDSPAAKGGLKAGDRFLEINDTVIPEGAEVDFLRDLIEGPPGSIVRFKVDDVVGGPERELRVRRGLYHLASVRTGRLGADRDLLYLHLSVFNDNTAVELVTAIGRAGFEPRGIVLDLRDNGGGSLQAAVDVVGAFVATDCVLRSVSRDGTRVYRPDRPPIADEPPLVVLVNGSSASASEIVAGALQDLRRGLLIGEETFGKGLVQSVYPLQSRPGGIKFTTSRWLTPAGRSLERRELDSGHEVGGIVPDFMVTIGREDDRRLKEWWGRLELDETILDLVRQDDKWLALAADWLDPQLTAALDAFEGRFPRRELVP